MRNAGKREMVVIINEVPYTLRLVEQPRDRLGRQCSSRLIEEEQRLEVMASLRVDEWLKIIDEILHFPPGASVIWEARPLVPVGA